MFDINTYITIAKNDSIDNAEQYRLSNSPINLFKFMPFYDSGNPAVNKRNIGTIEESRIWASKYSTLNDPFEFKSIYLDEDKIRKSGNSVNTFEKYRICKNFCVFDLLSFFVGKKNSYTLTDLVTVILPDLPCFYALKLGGFGNIFLTAQTNRLFCEV